MTRGRPSEDCPPEDPPDWFDAGGTQDAAASTSDGSDGNDGVRAGEWFDDPDHRPIETVPESTDEPTEGPAAPVANGATDGEGNATDVPCVTDEEGTGVDTPTGTAGTTDVGEDGGAGADESGPAGDGSEAVTAPQPPDGRERTAADTDDSPDGVDARGAENEVNETDAEETDATDSVVGRFLAYLRSVIERLS